MEGIIIPAMQAVAVVVVAIMGVLLLFVYFLNNRLFSDIKSINTALNNHVTETNAKIEALKTDVTALKTDVTALKTDVTALKTGQETIIKILKKKDS